MRLVILLSMCPTDLERELTAQQHLFPDYAQMRAHIVTIINSRTRGPAPMMMGNLNDEASHCDASSDEFVESEDGKLYRLEIRNGKEVFTKPRHESSKGNTKGGGKGRTDKEGFFCGRIGHIRADFRAKTHINGGLPKSAPNGKGVGNCEEEDPEISQNVTLGIIDLGSFEVLSDHGDAEDDGDVGEFSEEATKNMPPPPVASWFKTTETSKHNCIAGSFGNLAMETAETKSLHSSIVGMGSTSSMMFCSKWILGHETHRSLCPVKKVAFQ